MADISTDVKDFKTLDNSWTGTQTFNATPVIPSAISTDAASGLAVNKAYVDSRDSNYLPLSGGTVNGTLCANDYRCSNETGHSYLLFTSAYADDNVGSDNGAYIGLGSEKHGWNGGNTVDIVAYYERNENKPSGLYVGAESGTHKLHLAAISFGERKNLVRSVNGSNADEDGNVTLSSETWTFGLADGSTVTKSVLVK